MGHVHMITTIIRGYKTGTFITKSFFTSLPPKHESMKANLCQKAIKLAPNDNYFTEELVDIS